MVVKQVIQPRKAPKQARSRATVDAILRASARVLSREGFDRLSTNRVAEVAGVGVGSLYQYFPSKEALVAALVDRHREEIMQVFLARAAAAATKPVREAARDLVRAVLDAHLVDPKLHDVLREQLPKVGKLKDLTEDLDVIAYDVIRAYLASREHELRVRDVDRAAWVVVNTVENLVHRSVLGRGGGPEAVYEEIVDIVCRYLLKDS